jgi:hypothetical protein
MAAAVAGKDAIAAREPRYLAKDLRDPLRSLLPDREANLASRQNPAGSNQWGAAGNAQNQGNQLASAPPALKVTGLLWGGPEPQAIINDKVFHKNDEIKDGIILRAISRRGVMIEHLGKIFVYSVATGTPRLVEESIAP